MAKRRFRIEMRTGLDNEMIFDDEAGVVYVPVNTLDPSYAAIPTVDPADDGVTIWNDEGVLKVSGASG